MDREKAIILAAEDDKSLIWTIMKSKPQAPTISAIPMNEWEDHFQNLLTCENPPYDYHIFHSDHDYSRTFVESEILNRPIGFQEQGAKGIRRRIITLFCCSGLHSCLCLFDNCFRIRNTECCDSILGFSVGEACRCRLCDSQLRDNYQLLHCKNLCGTPFQ